MAAQIEKRGSVFRWLDTQFAPAGGGEGADRIEWLRCLPFVAIHAAVLLTIPAGWSGTAIGVAGALYLLRVFAITGFYHRYFSHRTFRTSRVFQFVMGVLGNTAVQRGPIWWAAHHRNHHRFSDRPGDRHSPRLLGFWRSHVGWFMTREGFATQTHYVKDWLQYPELRLLDRYDWLVPLLLFLKLYLAGFLLGRLAPSLGVSGPQFVVWGGIVSTVLVYHATYTINSLSHVFGRQRYATGDDSRNNAWLALLTLGEGWHNNHHHYPSAARQGFFWWEIDITYYGLLLLERLGLIWDLKPVPVSARERDRLDRPSSR
jgi:stearoyl-CoA desaturase (Delta-9 desaturase)